MISLTANFKQFALHNNKKIRTPDEGVTQQSQTLLIEVFLRITRATCVQFSNFYFSAKKKRIRKFLNKNEN